MNHPLNYFQTEIIKAGRKLAEVEPDHKALKLARSWWKDGCLCKYANQDFDVLQSLVSATYRTMKG